MREKNGHLTVRPIIVSLSILVPIIILILFVTHIPFRLINSSFDDSNQVEYILAQLDYGGGHIAACGIRDRETIMEICAHLRDVRLCYLRPGPLDYSEKNYLVILDPPGHPDAYIYLKPDGTLYDGKSNSVFADTSGHIAMLHQYVTECVLGR